LTIEKFALDDYLTTWVEQFLLDMKIQNLAGGKLKYYQATLESSSSFARHGHPPTKKRKPTSSSEVAWLAFTFSIKSSKPVF
jgi:hypothetical protein